jgi:uncharacterized membrane-anchored protein YhcB (DUF1043 family)
MWKMTLLAVISGILLGGCTTRGWYDAMKERQRIECGRYPQQYEVQRCLEKLNALTYDQYKNQTEELKAKQ